MLVKAFGCKQQKETEARKGGVYGKGAGSSQLTKGHKKRTSSFGEAGPRPPQGSWELGGGVVFSPGSSSCRCDCVMTTSLVSVSKLKIPDSPEKLIHSFVRSLVNSLSIYGAPPGW